MCIKKSIATTCLLILTLLQPNITQALESYEVQFEGVSDKSTLTLLKNTSQLISLKDSPPPTTSALRYRADADIPNLIKALHSLAYYNAKIETHLNLEHSPVLVTVTIDSGPVYPLAHFQVIPLPDCQHNPPFPYETISFQDLGISLGEPALPKKILGAEDALLQRMNEEGYPLAAIKQRDVTADQHSKSISVILHVDSGPQTTFGPTTITGCQTVDQTFINKKIAWQEGKIYTPDKVERTQNALEATGLFSSIHITPNEKAEQGQTLPMSIQVVESKHRSIGAGFSYSTDLGPGIIGQWEHRNFRGMGEKLSFKTSLWENKQEGSLLYLKPDYLQSGQDLLWLAELHHEKTKGFTESSCSISGTLEKQINDHTRISYGGMYKGMSTSHSDDNRQFNLFKTPFQLRWSNANNLLDPTKGATLNLKVIPSYQFLSPQFFYCIQTLTGSIYHPLTSDERIVLAAKGTVGTIFGNSRDGIPPSERFYAGSENTLRGYNYMTVSPLGKDYKPLGGRSMMVYSLEARVRQSEKWGWTVFYDIGNVYSSPIPQLNQKLLQSAGVGLRYHTPVGPVRFDVAFPLNRRPHVDSAFQLYLSIGQAF